MSEKFLNILGSVQVITVSDQCVGLQKKMTFLHDPIILQKFNYGL